MKKTDFKIFFKRSISFALCIVFLALCACSNENSGESETINAPTDAQSGALSDTIPPEDSSTDTYYHDSDSYNDSESEIESDSESEDLTEPPQTNAETEDTPLEKTDTPTILGIFPHCFDRTVIFGTCESNAAITYSGKNNVEYTDKACGKYFYVELCGEGIDTVTLYATSSGKGKSDAVSARVPFQNIETAVFAGRNSRLYLRETVGHLLGGSATTPSNLRQIYAVLNKRVQTIQSLTGKDTKLVYILAPNPVSIYYDEMHEYLATEKRNSTAVSQFVEYMNSMNNDDIIVPDLLSVFDAHKSEDIYYRTDTHWSELGAYYAYDAMMQFVKKDFPNVAYHPITDFDVVYTDCPAGDMANMLRAYGILREETPFLFPKFDKTGDFYPVKRAAGDIICNIPVGNYPTESVIDEESSPKAYLIGDSYGAYFLPYAGMSFSKLYTNPGVLWNYTIDYKKIEEEKPDYVIFVYTERSIGGDFMQLMFE